jgi:hypothetical protein
VDFIKTSLFRFGIKELNPRRRAYVQIPNP